MEESIPKRFHRDGETDGFLSGGNHVHQLGVNPMQRGEATSNAGSSGDSQAALHNPRFQALLARVRSKAQTVDGTGVQPDAVATTVYSDGNAMSCGREGVVRRPAHRHASVTK